MDETNVKSFEPAGVSAAGAVELVESLEANIGRVLKGKSEVIRLAVVSILARGHVLIEDVPGVGKTTLAQSLARSLGLTFQRIQFTSDLLPSDIIGVSVFSQKRDEFEFVAGPIFANVVLADEINRASPKTQSALLEAMGERKVSVDRSRYDLPLPFFVLATQNPHEYTGTFPLPESQLDRFLMALQVGYPPRGEERALLISGGVESDLESLSPVLSRDQLLTLQQRAASVKVAEKLADYMLVLAESTRNSEDFLLGVSTRAIQDLYRACQATALCAGRDYAIPDDVQQLAPSVLGHRVALRHQAGDLGVARDAIQRELERIPVPI